MINLFKILNLETINICNRSCFFCKFGNRKIEEKKQIMQISLIEKILNELKSLNYKGSIRLHHVNEPMLDKRIYEILILIKKYSKEIITEMTSNGDLINEKTIKKLYESGLDRLNLSAYENNSMVKFIELQKKWNFHIHDMRPSHQTYNKLTNQAGFIDLNEKLVKLKIKKVIKNMCNLPFEQLVIGSNGNVGLCCEDMYKLIDFGNANNNSLLEIWNSDKFNHYRKELKNKNRKILDLCKSCMHQGNHKEHYPIILEKK